MHCDVVHYCKVGLILFGLTENNHNKIHITLENHIYKLIYTKQHISHSFNMNDQQTLTILRNYYLMSNVVIHDGYSSYIKNFGFERQVIWDTLLFLGKIEV